LPIPSHPCSIGPLPLDPFNPNSNFSYDGSIQFGSNDPRMKRRRFLGWVGVGGLASSLPIAIAACSAKEAIPSSDPARSTPRGFQTVGTLSELQKGPILVTEGLGENPVLIVPDPSNPNRPVAVNPTCTPAGCKVDWQPDRAVFVCPCRGSEFDITRKVLKGPADKPLKTY